MLAKRSCSAVVTSGPLPMIPWISKITVTEAPAEMTISCEAMALDLRSRPQVTALTTVLPYTAFDAAPPVAEQVGIVLFPSEIDRLAWLPDVMEIRAKPT